LEYKLKTGIQFYTLTMLGYNISVWSICEEQPAMVNPKNMARNKLLYNMF